MRLHRSGFRETQTPQSARGPLGESGGNHGVSQSRAKRRQGLADLPRHDDVRRTDRRGDGGADRGERPRRRHQLHRHGRPVHRRPFGGDHRPRHQGEAGLVGARDQGREPDRRGAERHGPVAPVDHAGLRREPEAPRRRSRRHLLPAQGRPRHALGRDRARHGRPHKGGQDPLLRRLEFPRLARRRDLPHLRRDRHRPAGRVAALLQRHEPDAGGRAPAGLRPLRPRRRALLAARPRRAHRQVFARAFRRRRAPAPAARTRA